MNKIYVNILKKKKKKEKKKEADEIEILLIWQN